MMAYSDAVFIRRLWAAAVALTMLLVWFAGFDPLWAVASGIAVGTLGPVFATPAFEEAAWDPLPDDIPRGFRGDIVGLSDSFAACDRLAQPTALRWGRSLLIPEGDDRISRSIAERRMRRLLIADMHDRGLDPTNLSNEEVIVGLFGADAFTILQPSEHKPVTSVAIARCLDALHQLRTDTRGEP